MQDRRSTEVRRVADVDRLARIETRLVQLMIYLGANTSYGNTQGGFFDELREELDAALTNETCAADRDHRDGATPSTDWSRLDRPAYLRRGGKCPECPHLAPAAETGDPAV